MFYLGPIRRSDGGAVNKLSRPKRYVQALEGIASSSRIDDEPRERNADAREDWPVYERRKGERRQSHQPALFNTRVNGDRRRAGNPPIDLHV